MTIREQSRLHMNDLLGVLPQETVALDEGIQYSETEEEYADIVRRVVAEQIKQGNTCNCVISTKANCKIAEMTPQKALSIFRKILRNEFGAYMTFFFYDGECYHIGASPEKQVTVERNEVRMNPISGTFRKAGGEIDREKFIAFLENPKEQNELFMCLDEELKQMAQMCESGGVIVGPLLKEMSKLVHTEYELIGKSEKDIIDLLRTSLHAPTVTGSPRQSAHRIIADMESESREYYAGTLALMGHHADGTEFLDSSIMIRTMNILPNGLVSMRVGSSIVRDSIPEEEAKECRAKLAGVSAALVANNPGRVVPQLPLLMDEEIRQILLSRGIGLNRYLVENQEGKDLTIEELKGKTITIIDNEDHFSHMIGHMTTAMGADVRVVSYQEYVPEECHADIVIVGPGPGNPSDASSDKMRKVEEITKHLLTHDRVFLSVCLGHQVLCKQLGFPLERKQEPTQGVQREIDFFGERQRVGSYNTFTAMNNRRFIGTDVAFDEGTKEIHAIRRKRFSGLQFHPESIFSENGFDILAQELRHLALPRKAFENERDFYTNALRELDAPLARRIDPQPMSNTSVFRLKGLRTISPEAAKILVERHAELDLDGISHLTPEVAFNLAQCRATGMYGSCVFVAPLVLPNLKIVSPDVASALVNHPHILLYIDHLDETVATAFLQNAHSCRVCLSGLKTVTPQAVEVMKRAKKRTTFQLEDPSDEVIEVLRQFGIEKDDFDVML